MYRSWQQSVRFGCHWPLPICRRFGSSKCCRCRFFLQTGRFLRESVWKTWLWLTWFHLNFSKDGGEIRFNGIDASMICSMSCDSENRLQIKVLGEVMWDLSAQISLPSHWWSQVPKIQSTATCLGWLKQPPAEVGEVFIYVFIFYRCFASRLHFGRRSGTQLPGHGAAVLCQVGYAVLNVVTWLPWFRELPAEMEYVWYMYGICMRLLTCMPSKSYQIVMRLCEVRSCWTSRADEPLSHTATQRVGSSSRSDRWPIELSCSLPP